MTVRRNCVGVLQVKVCDCDGQDDIVNFDRHQLGVMHIADVLLRVMGHQRDEIAARIIAIVCLGEGQGVDILAGEKLRLHGYLNTKDRMVTKIKNFWVFLSALCALRV